MIRHVALAATAAGHVMHVALAVTGQQPAAEHGPEGLRHDVGTRELGDRLGGRIGLLGGGGGSVADHTLWWPPSKVAGRRLAPYLAARDEPSNRGRGPGMAGLAVQTDLARELSAASA